MNVFAQNYRDAASDRLADAYVLYREGRYVMSLYNSGLAVECIFRAHRVRVDPIFDARHDLIELYRVSRLKQTLEASQEAQLAAALSQLTPLWRNHHRFDAPPALIRFLKRGRHDRGIRGDVLKEASRRAYNASETIVGLAVFQWKN